jgi:hypothetical protein
VYFESGEKNCFVKVAVFVLGDFQQNYLLLMYSAQSLMTAAQLRGTCACWVIDRLEILFWLKTLHNFLHKGLLPTARKLGFKFSTFTLYFSDCHFEEQVTVVTVVIATVNAPSAE